MSAIWPIAGLIGVFGIAIGGVWREIEGSLADLPSERTAEPGEAGRPGAAEQCQRHDRQCLVLTCERGRHGAESLPWCCRERRPAVSLKPGPVRGGAVTPR